MKSTGFTLIELIIVIAVIAILATTVVLVLNPLNILQEARDSQRLTDLSNLSSAFGLYLTAAGTASLGDPANCYVEANSGVTTAGCGGRHGTKVATSGNRSVDGTGWIPVNFGLISGGSPLSVLPVDPTNDTTYYYSYVTDGSGVYELDANMESSRYANNGSDDKESTDGGNNADLYEVSNNMGAGL